MSWRPLERFDDRRVGKLYRLKVAARRRMEVPPTWWARAPLPADVAPPSGLTAPLVVRSAAEDEDRAGSTAAGRYESVVVESDDAAEFAAACARVAASMGGAGTLFVQPLAEASLGTDRAGVAFFDGFHYERTEARGNNRALTAGEERGDVVRADLVRGEAWSAWLERLGRVFARELESAGAIDVEYARSGDRYVLLQVRPAPFEVRANPILSLANHREILGDHPSPWIVDALERAGRAAVDEFARVDPIVGTWGARYAEVHVGRAWLSFSFFFRLMDHWGLPRAFVTEGVGGEASSPLDARPRLGRMVVKSGRLVRLQLRNLSTIRRIPRGLAAFDARIAAARSLGDWFAVTAWGLDLALRTNFAINGALSGLTRVRRALGVRGRARVVTEEMMEEYSALRALPAEDREAALDAWLERFGHRGPLESDPMQPRFGELRDVLLADVTRGDAGVGEAASGRPGGRRRGLLFALDRRRESFRDELMLRWRTLREGLLAAADEVVAAGWLDERDDAFLLGSDAELAPETWRERVEAARARREREAGVVLPATARRDEILAAAEAVAPSSGVGSASALRGIGLGQRVVSGVVRRADDLTALLRDEAAGGAAALGPRTVLVVPALEPAWGVVFGRVGAVVTEIGGELSHASILLREAGTPALVNCAGVWAAVSDGDEVTIDERAGTLTRAG